MTATQPLAVRESRAAELLDMPPARFRALVAQGALPPPVLIGDVERWYYPRLWAIAKDKVHLYDESRHGSWYSFMLLHMPKRYSRHIPDAVKKEVWDRDGKVCAYCLTTEGPFELDHIHPVSRGGENTAENLTVACKPCNSSKRAMTVEEWMEGKS